MDVDRYVEHQPYLYHLTDQSNLCRIREEKVLFCAAELMKRAGRTDLLRTRRQNHEPVEVNGSTVWLRDQEPLYRANIELTGGFTFEEFVETLNARVFFWPGKDKGPVRQGENHFGRYASERPAILRCHFQALRSHNPFAVPLFCAYNSGAPRTVSGKKSPRGPNTFLNACDSPRTPSKVVEVTFLGEIELPPDTEVRQGSNGSWQSFF